MSYYQLPKIPLGLVFLIDYLNAQHQNDQEFLKGNFDKVKIVPKDCKPIINEDDSVYGFFATMDMDDGTKQIIEIIRIGDEENTFKYYTRILTNEEIEIARRNTIKK